MGIKVEILSDEPKERGPIFPFLYRTLHGGVFLRSFSDNARAQGTGKYDVLLAPGGPFADHPQPAVGRERVDKPA